jgi:iron-sulfur cluster repair protein YtfE (RIC family)
MTITAPSSALADSLRHEHVGLRAGIHRLAEIADTIEMEAPAGVALAAEAYRFLAQEIVPHAGAEDLVLYPIIDLALGDGATASLRRDHMEISGLVDALRAVVDELTPDGPNAQETRQLRRLLYGLHEVLLLHLANEEEVFLPAVENTLSAEVADLTLHGMHRAATQLRSEAAHSA